VQRALTLFFLGHALVGCGAEPATQPAPAPKPALNAHSLSPAVRRAFDDDQPGFARLAEPKPGEWRERFNEPGQSFGDFERGARVVPSPERGMIFVLPIGAFPEGSSPPLAVLIDYIERFFGLPARLMPALPDARELRARSRKHHGVEQLLSGDLLAALRDRIPPEAYGLVGVTMHDLFPAPSWNYVFGEATFDERVGIYSFARYDPAFHREPRTADTSQLILTRSLKVMTHEIGHMFGIAHCTAYRCLMNGTNSLEETDASTLHLCPVCLRKLQRAVGFVPGERYRKLERFYAERGMREEAEWVGERAAYAEEGSR
jgi:archaemetzincin